MRHFKDISTATVSVDLRESIGENTICGNETIHIYSLMKEKNFIYNRMLIILIY